MDKATKAQVTARSDGPLSLNANQQPDLPTYVAVMAEHPGTSDQKILDLVMWWPQVA